MVEIKSTRGTGPHASKTSSPPAAAAAMAMPVVDKVAADMAPPFSSAEVTLPDPELLEPELLGLLLEEVVVVPLPIGSATYETPFSLAVYSAKGGMFAFVSPGDPAKIAESPRRANSYGTASARPTHQRHCHPRHHSSPPE